MTNPIKNKKKVSAHNKLNDLTAKEWLINTKSVWKSTDYHLNIRNSKIEKKLRYLRNLILFFTKKSDVILNPNNVPEISNIGEREGRIILTKAIKDVDFILIQANRGFPNLKFYKNMLHSDEFKSEFVHYFHTLKNGKYLCVMVRDFYIKKNYGLILYHYDLANLLGNIGFKLKGLIIWIASEKKGNSSIEHLNRSIINDYFLIFRKENKKQKTNMSRVIDFQLHYDDTQVLAEKTRFYTSYMKSITPTRDKFKTQHPATFPEPDIKKLIKLYTDIKKRPKVLDPFCGVGSTLIACSELNVEGYGIELTKKWVDLTKKRFNLRRLPIQIDGKTFTPQQKSPKLFMESKREQNLLIQKIEHGDAQEKIQMFPNNYFDFIITSPPYWGILTKKIDHKMKKERVEKGFETKYTIEGKDETFKKDLANIKSYREFLNQLKKVYKKCYKKLKNLGYGAIIVSDFRNGPDFYLYHGDTANILKSIGFKLIGMTILHQDNKNLYPYGYPYSFVSNIHHQFIVIVKKEEI